MRRLGLLLLLAAAAVGFAATPARSAPPPGAPTRTSTRTSNVAPPLSRQDAELAAYLDVLMDLDLLANFELLALLPALEVDDDR